MKNQAYFPRPEIHLENIDWTLHYLWSAFEMLNKGGWFLQITPPVHHAEGNTWSVEDILAASLLAASVPSPDSQ